MDQESSEHPNNPQSNTWHLELPAVDRRLLLRQVNGIVLFMTSRVQETYAPPERVNWETSQDFIIKYVQKNV